MTILQTLRRLALGLALAATALTACAADGAARRAPATPAAAASAPREVLVMLRSPPPHARVDGSYGAAGYGDAARAQSQARVGARIAAAHGLTVVTLWAMPALGMDCVVLALPPRRRPQASIAALQTHSEVAWAQPMNEFHAQGHADPLYALQPVAAQWHLDDLHAIATGRHVHVAIIDSGVDDTHPDLAQAVQARANFVDDRAWVAELHGTAVAGLVAARADNGIGIVGIAPEAQLYALRACWEVSASQTLCNSLSLAKALSFAIDRKADVINMSLSGPVDLLLGRLIDVALSHRQQVVAAVDARAAGGGFPAGAPGRDRGGRRAGRDAAGRPRRRLVGARARPADDRAGRRLAHGLGHVVRGRRGVRPAGRDGPGAGRVRQAEAPRPAAARAPARRRHRRVRLAAARRGALAFPRGHGARLSRRARRRRRVLGPLSMTPC
jgi:hypothetical protein